ncbi:953fb5eb-bb50-4919-b2f0-6abf6cf3a96f [Sclerotinia trifoliorum]|uniref:953fb5eb-bb50-4919-b2f0-6abf6cf3a96f n=1 Tax=Sclerotinia trifoliorum TaxID=28548 RepID=A0A8H2ZTM1_9HELO|nr:953fb5eb-bb50-4919-b2f0-6abf6cf3a96f [Sclerotinia trifoliorum]
MSKFKTSTKSKAKPKSIREKSKLRSTLIRTVDKHRIQKHPAPSKTKAKNPIIIDLTSSPPPPTKQTTATPKRITLPSSSERSPGINSPITRSLSLSLAKPSIIPNPPKPTQPPEYYIQPIHIQDITPGTVVWLPSKVDIVHNAFVDPKLHTNAFDHPAIIISMPNPANIFSVVEIAIMTTLGSRTLHETKNLTHRNLLFRVRTSQLPSAKVDITFKDAKGMKGKYSFVNCRESWRVQIGTLGFYARGKGRERGKEDWLCLTKGSLEKLRASIGCGMGLWD